jgi:hypothetical protein
MKIVLDLVLISCYIYYRMSKLFTADAYIHIAQLVERKFSKLDVSGSNPEMKSKEH